MSRVYSDTVLPEDSGVSQDLTLGTTSDTVQVTSGASLNVNTVKDSGGNTIFTSDGSGTLSSLNAAFQGKPTLITANTVTDQASVDFTTGITSTYNLYIFRFYAINPATDDVDFSFQGNAVGQSGYNETITSSSFRTYHDEADTTSAVSYDGNADQAQGTAFQLLNRDCGNDADQSSAGELYLFTPSNTTYVKQFYAKTDVYTFHDFTATYFIAGYFNTTSAINAISFKCSSGNFDGIIKMYGL